MSRYDEATKRLEDFSQKLARRVYGSPEDFSNSRVIPKTADACVIGAAATAIGQGLVVGMDVEENKDIIASMKRIGEELLRERMECIWLCSILDPDHVKGEYRMTMEMITNTGSKLKELTTLQALSLKQLDKVMESKDE